MPLLRLGWSLGCDSFEVAWGPLSMPFLHRIPLPLAGSVDLDADVKFGFDSGRRDGLEGSKEDLIF
jgi:hypothetical protein